MAGACDQLIYNFSQYDSLTSWQNYAASIGATTFLNKYQSDGVLAVQEAEGFIQLTLPDQYDHVTVNYGNAHTSNRVYITLNGVEKQRIVNRGSNTYVETYYPAGSVLKVWEDIAIINKDLRITLRRCGSAQCASCPANSSSAAGSDASADCKCAAGFTGADGGPCALCAAGTYDLGDACLACPANADSVPGAIGPAACLCRPGYFGPPGGPCRACAHGSYSESNQITCTACGANFNTTSAASTSAAACLCVPGHYLFSTQICTPCPNNTYTATLSSDSCTACTQHSTSPPGSASPAACACSANFLKRAGNGTCARVCAAGFEAGGASLTECVGCRPGAYKTLEGDHACTPCPPNAFSLLANQTSISSCVCQHGYIFNATSLLCDACPPGTFNNRANETQCFACVTEC